MIIFAFCLFSCGGGSESDNDGKITDDIRGVWKGEVNFQDSTDESIVPNGEMDIEISIENETTFVVTCELFESPLTITVTNDDEKYSGQSTITINGSNYYFSLELEKSGTTMEGQLDVFINDPVTGTTLIANGDAELEKKENYDDGDDDGDDDDGPIEIGTGSFSIPLGTYSLTISGNTTSYIFKSENKLDIGYNSTTTVSDATYTYNSSDGTLNYSYPEVGGTSTWKYYHVFTVTKDGKTHLQLRGAKIISGDPTKIAGLVTEYRVSASHTGTAIAHEFDLTTKLTYHSDGTYTMVTTNSITGEITTTTGTWEENDIWGAVKIDSDYYVYGDGYTQQ